MNTFTKNRSWWLLALFALISLLLAGCGKASSSPSADPIVGAYKCGAKYSKTEDGAVQPGYWYFKKNGKLLYCVPQIAHNEHFHPGYEISHGTWKRLGNNRYQINLRSDYEGDSFNLKGSLENDHLTIPAAKGWNKEVDSKISMTSATFAKMFNKTKRSELGALHAIASSSSSAEAAESRKNADLSTNNNGPATSDASQSADPDEIGRAIYSQVFPSEEVDSVEKDGDRYYVSNEYHSADSTIPFQINGDTVTYWTQADGDTTADGQNEAHTVSIDDLLGN